MPSTVILGFAGNWMDPRPSASCDPQMPETSTVHVQMWYLLIENCPCISTEARIIKLCFRHDPAQAVVDITPDRTDLQVNKMLSDDVECSDTGLV